MRFRIFALGLLLAGAAASCIREDMSQCRNAHELVLSYLGDGKTDFRLELTWLRDHPQKYDLGECEFHLALRAEDYETAHARHAEMGCICFENPAMGIYFISDPDGYWIEIIPTR